LLRIRARREKEDGSEGEKETKNFKGNLLKGEKIVESLCLTNTGVSERSKRGECQRRRRQYIGSQLRKGKKKKKKKEEEE